MSGISIRAARAADAAAIAGLITELGSPTEPPAMAERLARVRGRNDTAALVAEADGAVVAFAGVFLSPSFVRDTRGGQIVAFVVAESHRRRGVGRALLAAAEGWLRDRGVARVMLVSGSHRGDAHAFYRSCGYDHTGLRFVKGLE